MLTMITQTTGAVINLIFDPILIFGLYGMPKLGVAGAAIATVLGQLVAATMAVIFNIKYNKEIHISFKKFRPDSVAINQIIATGIPSMIMQAIGSLGFPIVISLLMFYQLIKEQEAHKEEMNGLKDVIQENTKALISIKEHMSGGGIKDD